MAVPSGKRIFIVGPGFIGWNVLDLLAKEGHIVTGLVRRQEHADQIQSSGATAVLGDLNDKAVITQQATEHEVIFHTATADHLTSVEAILDGVKQRAERGQTTIFIHTSGTSVLDDGADGRQKSDKIYHDDVREEIDTVPDDAPHRQIDLAIVRAQKALGDNAKLAIMIPPLIYGYNPSHKRLTIQIPTLTRFALKHGFAGHMGAGLAVESNIHVLDLARAYILLMHHLDRSDPADTQANPYFFCETTADAEPSWRDVAAVIGEGLHRAGKIDGPEPREIPQDLYKDVFGDFTGAVIGLNSRSRANRLRALGWTPQEKGWKESFLHDELPEILKENVSDFSGYGGTAAS